MQALSNRGSPTQAPGRGLDVLGALSFDPAFLHRDKISRRACKMLSRTSPRIRIDGFKSPDPQVTMASILQSNRMLRHQLIKRIPVDGANSEPSLRIRTCGPFPSAPLLCRSPLCSGRYRRLPQVGSVVAVRLLILMCRRHRVTKQRAEVEQLVQRESGRAEATHRSHQLENRDRNLLDPSLLVVA